MGDEIRVRHETVVDAAPSLVYELITNVERWPVIFRPTVHTRLLERCETGDRVDIWATMSGRDVRTWRSRREFDPMARTVTFGQDHVATSFGHMGGGWTCVPRGGRTAVTLEHRYRSPTEAPAVRQRIADDLEYNASTELAALQSVATLPDGVDQWLLTFTDSVGLVGSADAAREFVWDAGRWPDRLPHVAELDLTTTGETQGMTMRTRAPDGSMHTTRSVRVLLADGSVVYKQTQPPQVLLGHSGHWEFLDGPAGATIHSTHTFLLDPAGVAEEYGPTTSAADAMARVRAALRANSRATMEHASRYASTIEAAT